MKKYVLVAFFIFVLNIHLFSQPNKDALLNYYTNESIEEKVQNIRSGSIFFGIGIVDVFSLGVSKQINNELSISLKGAGVWVGSGYYVPNSGGGVGFKLGYHFKLFFVNIATIEIIPLLQLKYYRPDKPIKSLIKGYYFDVNIGKEKINEQGLSFFWAFGFCLSAARYESLLYFPSLKIGLNYNFIKPEQ